MIAARLVNNCRAYTNHGTLYRSATSIKTTKSLSQQQQQRTYYLIQRLKGSNNTNTNTIYRRHSTTTTTTRTPPQTEQEKMDAIRKTNETLKSYTETRILAKQGKLKIKNDYYNHNKSKRQHRFQFMLSIGLALGIFSAPFLGKRIATDDEFRNTYIPEWYLPKPIKDKIEENQNSYSEITRNELHEQVIQLQNELHIRALRGDFTPEKLNELKLQKAHGSNLSKEDLEMAEKYNWAKIHPLDDDDEEDE